ncbi:8-amino-7-oxononanoate synthase [uncultured Dokdonia sp.]|uniref:aminotransferase class I/II-fold pyridoxal phosphate-dependent enzyme n=1 Tax=uncultured Dokdonia sp. TaxID=575653 RepID=UPI0026188DF6|nr:8-amino-7-oxononanoate synthase [uncultured Dokdonia sp.]
MKLPNKLQKKLNTREAAGTLRVLKEPEDLVDFSSNDYLGLSRKQSISRRAIEILEEHDILTNGATGSRLLSGNHKLYPLTEEIIASFHESETALIFNSGYDANIGFFQAVPQRGDIILYDEYIHASIRDGIVMSHAKAYKFKHNDIKDLIDNLERIRELSLETNTYVITESVFSMDGDHPDLVTMAQMCKAYKSYLVVDEAHATGVVGTLGQGLVQKMELQNEVFASIITFGKALGAHGAAVLGSDLLKQYLVNFARSFIYTTGLPPHSIATILASYEYLSAPSSIEKPFFEIETLKSHIDFFNEQIVIHDLQSIFIPSTSAIHCAVLPGNERVKTISQKLKKEGYDVKPILSPTVPEGQERLRICLHSYNTQQEIKSVLSLLKNFTHESIT